MSAINLNDLAQRFFQAMNIRSTGNITRLFECIFPYQATNNYYQPLPASTPPIPINVDWRTFYTTNYIRQYIPNLVDIDNIIGQAIHDRLAPYTRSGMQPAPYQHQASAIIKSLELLNDIRDSIRNRGVIPSRLNKVLGLLTDTASGKTEVFETIALQLVLDTKIAYQNHINNKRLEEYATGNVKIIIIYPMKSLMIDHFRRFIKDLYYVNNYLQNNRVHPISVGVYIGDTPSQINSKGDLLRWGEYLLGRCPICGFPLDVLRTSSGYVLVCSNTRTRHVFRFFRASRSEIKSLVPDILFTNFDMLNLHIREVLKDLLRSGPPLMMVLDEPHEYISVFGANVSLFIRTFEQLIRDKHSRRWSLSRDFHPIYFVSSATIPNYEEFLAKLLVKDISSSNTFFCTSNYCPPMITQPLQTRYQSNIGIIGLLPSADYGLQNAAVEIPLVIAAILPRYYRKVLVFVDSVEYAEKLKSQIEDYKNKQDGFQREYQVCRNVGNIFSSDVCPSQRYRPDFVEVYVIHARMPDQLRREIENRIRQPDNPAIIITTPALEIGVDIGDVTATVLIGIPPNPISFRQRIGRIGRRQGRPGLAIMVGNEKKPVDNFYLSNYNNFIDYLRASRRIRLPLTPLNPVLVRSWLGNYIYGYVRMRQYNPNDIIQNYRYYTLNYPSQIFQSLANASPAFGLLAGQYNRLSNQLLADLNNILSHLSPNLINNIRRLRLYATSQQIYRGTLYSIRGVVSQALRGQYVPFIVDNLRESGEKVKILFPNGLYNLSHRFNNRRANIELELDLRITLTQYSTADLGLQHIPQYAPRFLRRYLVGTIHYRTYPGNITIPLETTYIEGDYSAFQTHINTILSSINILSNNINTIFSNNFITTIESIVAGNVAYASLIKVSQYRRIANTLQRWLTNQQNILRGSPGGQLIEIYKPTEIYLENLLANIVRIKHGNANHHIYAFDEGDIIQYLRNNGLLGRSYSYAHLMQRGVLVSPLPYLVMEMDVNGYRRIAKLDIQNRNMRGVDLGQSYNFRQCDLVVQGSGRNISCGSYHSVQGQVLGITDNVYTRPQVLSVIANIPRNNTQTSAICVDRSNNYFRVYYCDNLETLLVQLGFHVYAKCGSHRIAYFRRIGNASHPLLLGHRYYSKGVIVEINWDSIINQVFRGINEFYNYILSIHNIYNSVYEGIMNQLQLSNMSQNDIIEDFILGVAHSLAHAIINFHSLYTGIGAENTGEYIEYDRDNRVTWTVIFDYDEGGNGASEIIFTELNNILADALTTIIQVNTRILNNRNIPSYYVIEASPHDLLFHFWPICQYGNLVLRRLYLLEFFLRLAGLNSRTLHVQMQQPGGYNNVRNNIYNGISSVLP